MAIEKYIAAASLGLFVMFVGEIITIYNFMGNPPGEIDPANPISQFEAAPKILQFISIGVAPALVLSAVSFIMSKRYGSKPIATMITAGGIILLVGMIIAYFLIDDVHEAYMVEAVEITPPLFIAVSIPVIIIGLRLFRIKKRRPKKEYF